MSYLVLNDDVYLVKGKVRHCLYDLNKGDLYSISEEAKEVLLKIMQINDASHELSGDESEFVDYLTKAGVLIESSVMQNFTNITTIKKNYPLDFAWIEVTRACNMSCSFCYESSSAICLERMSVEDFIKVKEEVKDVGIKKIQFIGGEPLIIGDDLKKMIKLCRDDFSNIEVYTNGTLLNQEWYEFFKQYNVHIALSVHSYLAEEHDKVTHTKGSHEKTLAAIQQLTHQNIPFRVEAVQTQQCKIGERPQDCLFKLKPDCVRLTGKGNFNQYSLEMFEKKAITKKKMTSRLKKEWIIKNVSGQKCFLKDLYISANLEVFPCVMERRFCHGNLKTHHLKEIISEDIRQLSKDHIEGCKECEYRYACFDCRPDSNGADKYAKPWYCSYDPFTGNWCENLEEMFLKLKNTESE